MAISTLQRRLYVNGSICGFSLALLITLFELLGWLNPLEAWLYDLRAATCQNNTPAPSPDIVYLDIDDGALDTIQRWPWDRSRMAAVLEELKLANPKVVMLDVIFAEPQPDRIERTPDNEYRTIEEDPALARAMDHLDNVVLATSLVFKPAPDAAARLRADAVATLSKDVTTELPQLIEKLQLTVKSRKDARLLLEAEFPLLRREAIRQAIRNAFDAGADRIDAVQRKIIPALDDPDATNLLRFKLHTDIIAQEFDRVRSERILAGSTLEAPTNLRNRAADAIYNTIPLPILCEQMATSGFADHRLFKDPVVRSVPLFLNVDGKLYPQLALATACELLNADLSKAALSDDIVRIPAPGGEIRIPVRAPYSDTMRRRVGFVMDIPWYGGNQWETMNDWPALVNRSQHYPIDSIWTAVESQRRLNANNAILRTCLGFFYELDTSFKHAELAGEAAVIQLKKDLTEFGYDQLLKADAGTLTESEKLVVKWMSALLTASEQNAVLQTDLKLLRAQNVQRFSGKAVLIGATATSTGDFASTSLHTTCPGVVVHGVIMNAIVNRDFLTTAPLWFNILTTLFAGLLATLITCLLPPARGVFLLILMGIAYFVTNGLLFYDKLNWVVDAAAPLVAMFVCWGGVIVVITILETLEALRLKREAALIEHEIDLAKQVQEQLIPKELQVLPQVDSHGWTKAATTTGGDCFDLWRLKDGRMGVLVADASGHGLGPSIVVSQVRALVRSMCDLYTEPQELLKVVNARLAEDLGGRKFCTCFLGFMAEDGKLTWSSFGHGPMLWAPTSDGAIEELNGTALPLGVSDDPFADDSVPVLEIRPGGWLAVVSDGIFECADPKGDQYGTERINVSILAARDQPSSAVVEAIRRSVDVWQVKPIPDDDQTIVFLRLHAQGQGSRIPSSTETDAPSDE